MDSDVDRLIREERLLEGAALASQRGDARGASLIYERACDWQRAAAEALRAGDARRALSLAVYAGDEPTAERAIALASLDAAEAHRALIAVKGVGPWTADIFLLFCLGHPDAFPAGDLALQEAAKLALNLKRRPDAARLERIAERWRPLRGVAARMLWAYYRGVKARSGMALANSSR